MGAVLFAVGVHPQTGDIWQLGTEAQNKSRELVGEPALRGEFIINQASRAQLASGTVVEPLAVHNLDDHDPFTAGVQYDPTRSVGQPYALAFGGSGEVYVSGLLTDNVTEYTSAGDFVREWDVGSIPRGLLPTADGSGLLVYLWGSNTVELWDLAPASPQLTTTLDLGYDPTPMARREGRRIFFDASHSMFGNASCASCHVETDADLLAWDLSNLPFDDKGPLVTQFMRGIEDLVPFHWRGERAELVDFNGAFDGLLGGPPLDTAPGSEVDLFEEYVFSTVQPANPFEDERRVVVDRGTYQRASGQVVKADAVNGQNVFHDFQIIPTVATCADCHTMPSGTNNDVVFDEPQLNFARRTHFAVASFNGLWRKRQRTLERIQLRDGTY
jgi:mono/diheme cytochrome c family protein